MEPQALVLTGYGINCDYESEAACARAGFSAVRVHLVDLIERTGMLFQSKLVVFPGGFSFGDDLGSGVAFSARIRYAEAALFDLLLEYVEKGGLILGICNGFQILVRLGLLPAAGDRYGEQQVTLAPNREGYFIDRWVSLGINESSHCIFTRGLLSMELPVRHGEGRFLPAAGEMLKLLEKEGQVCLRYCGVSGLPTQEFPQNPNGSVGAIAGICDPSGRVFGLMPHPEAAVTLYHHPDWGKRNQRSLREGRAPAPDGDGHRIFKNAYEYVK
jgi:phosphoribosylformylglycinamidine synthase I